MIKSRHQQFWKKQSFKLISKSWKLFLSMQMGWKDSGRERGESISLVFVVVVVVSCLTFVWVFRRWFRPLIFWARTGKYDVGCPLTAVTGHAIIHSTKVPRRLLLLQEKGLSLSLFTQRIKEWLSLIYNRVLPLPPLFWPMNPKKVECSLFLDIKINGIFINSVQSWRVDLRRGERERERILPCPKARENQRTKLSLTKAKQIKYG